MGVLCGLEAWKPLVVVVAGVLFLLLAGGSMENWCQKVLKIEEKADPPDSACGGVASASFVKGLAAKSRHDRHGSGHRFRSAADGLLQNSGE